MIREDVVLRHPATGDVAVCPGRGGVNILDYETLAARQRACVDRYRAQGYLPIPKAD